MQQHDNLAELLGQNKIEMVFDREAGKWVANPVEVRPTLPPGSVVIVERHYYHSTQPTAAPATTADPGPAVPAIALHAGGVVGVAAALIVGLGGLVVGFAAGAIGAALAAGVYLLKAGIKSAAAPTPSGSHKTNINNININIKQ